METIVKTEYQDIYRIKSGVLLVVNKFNSIRNESISYSIKSKPYNKLTQQLRITEEYCKTYKGNHCQKGTVTDGYHIYKLVVPNDYQYIIKTTGCEFNGKPNELIDYFEGIKEVLSNYTK